MSTVTLTDDKLNEIIDTAAHKAAEDTITSLLSSKKALNRFLEMAEDRAFGNILQNTPTGNAISGGEFLGKLNKHMAGLK
jgi:hypothetical protein